MSIMPPARTADQQASRYVPTSLYRYFDESGILIYVGITARSTKRQGEHNRDKDWWQYVTSQTVEHFPDRPAALRRETDVIRTYSPPFNTQQNPHHKQARAAYLAVRSLMEEEARWVMSGTKNDWRLVPHSRDADGNNTVLRTAVPIAGVTLVQVSPRLRAASKSRRWGHVLKVWREGPFLLFRIDGALPPILGAALRATVTKSGTQVYVEGLFITPAYETKETLIERRRVQRASARLGDVPLNCQVHISKAAI